MTIREKRVRATLQELREAPLRPATAAANFGSTLVVAAHPEDESLGCGGTIALLRSMEVDVRVLVLGDGARTPPRKGRQPMGALRKVRERESLAALEILGVGPSAVAFLRLEECTVPTVDTPGFDEVAALCRSHIAAFAPSTVLLPWRRDPHIDHRATWQLIDAARSGLRFPLRLIEYPIWVWSVCSAENVPYPDEALAWRLDIREVQAKKQAAIAAYRSQLISSPESQEQLQMRAEMLTHFAYPWEVFLEG